LLAYLLVFSVDAVPVQATARIPFTRVLGSITRPGAALFLQGVGFAAIGAFITLLFDSMHWANAGLALSGFGAAFVLVRLLAGHLPDRMPGFLLASVSFLVEILGQVLLWKAPNGAVALTGATITGLGCSLMFPSLGVEVVKAAPPQNRGTALGAFAAFQDVSYGITGPLAGIVAAGAGYKPVFLIGALAAVCGLFVSAPRAIGAVPASLRSN
jgi:MFS family permease